MSTASAGSHYWARFEFTAAGTCRFDTRIYLSPCVAPRAGDRALGCIIGKNPGSALPAQGCAGLQPIRLQGDRFLPTVRAILGKACAAAGTAVPDGAYLQVLNLFYLCNRDLRAAKAGLAAGPVPAFCASERRRFPWRWYAWGGPDPLLDPLKRRFLGPRRSAAFFIETKSGDAVPRRPALMEHARHTQGMHHDAVVAHLAALLSR